MRSVDEQGDVLYSERPAVAATSELSAKAREMLEAGKANTTDSAGRLWLSTLPLDRVAADYGKDVRGLKPLVDAIFQKEAFATAKATDVDRWVRQFEQLADRQALEDLLYDANERGVFPHMSMEEQADVVKRRVGELMQVEKLTKADAQDVVEGYFDDLSARFERLTPDARKLYRTITDELEARRQTLQQALERFITVMEHDDTARKARIAQLRRAFNKVKGPYFPVLRFGNFGVSAYASDGKLLEFVLVESRSQQARAAEFLKARHPQARIQEFKQSEMDRLLGGVSDSALVDDMQNMVARSVEDTQLRATLQREMQKIFISSLPEYHARQRFLPRRFVPGARRDAPRSFGRAMLSSLRYEAQLRFNPRIQGALKDLADFASGKPSRRHAYLVSMRTTDGNATAELYESQEAALAALGDAVDRGTLDTYRIATLTSDAAKARADATNVLGLLSNAERDALLDPMLERAAAVTGRPVPPNTNIARDIETEVRKRMNAIVDSDTPPTIQFLGNLTYLYHLGVTPSFVLANLSQNPLVTLPMLAAKFGMGRSARAMGKYAKQVAADMRGPFKSGWRTGSFDVAKLTSVTPEQRRLLEHLLANNLLDLTQSLDLGRAVEGSGKASEMWQKVMRYGTLTGHYSEIFNRVVAALTALELANERAGSAGLETEAARFEYVRNVISRTHMNYSAINRPGLMTRSQLTRLMFQFRTYAFGMTHHILRMFNDAIRGESAEIKAEARRMLFYSVGTGLLAAGLRGLPFYSAYILAAAALGIDDPEREMAGYITKLTGSKDVAETLLRGPMYLAGGDMSERIGLGSVIPFTNLFGQQTMGPTDSALAQATFDLVMGPFGGIAKNALVTAPEHWSNGDPWRAAELVVPKFIRDPMQAVRWADEGVQTRRGDVIMAADALGVGDYFWKAAGVQPAEVARLYDERGQMFKLRDQIAKGKSRYLIRYRAAVMQGDMEEAAQVREEAAQAAREDRSMAIKPRQWVDAVRRQSARNLLLESTGGLAATKDERRLLETLIDEVE